MATRFKSETEDRSRTRVPASITKSLVREISKFRLRTLPRITAPDLYERTSASLTAADELLAHGDLHGAHERYTTARWMSLGIVYRPKVE